MREIFQIAKRGLFANQKGLDVTGQNVANANTEGYSRQRVNLSPEAFRKGNLQVGLGVEIEDIERLRSDQLDRQIRSKESEIGYLDQRKQILAQLENIFATDTDGDLDIKVNELFDSFSRLTSNPEDESLRSNVIRSSQNLAETFNRLDRNLNQVKERIGDTTETLVTKVNQLLKEIASLDRDITSGEGEGQSSNNKALDLRTRKLNELSELVDTSITIDENKSATVSVGGLVLVQNGQARTLEAEINPSLDINRIRIEGSKVLNNIGGRLGATIESFTEDVGAYSDRLDNLAKTIVEEVNNIHSSGYTLNNTTGLDLFDAGNTTAESISVNSQVSSDPDNVAASSQPNEPGNAEKALALADLRNDDTVFSGQTFSEFAVNMSTSIGSELNAAASQLETTSSAQTLLENQQESVAGVNIDEELTNLIQYQNAYQASARVLSTARQMFDSLLTIA
ncbi:MAG: flagellar hook-associated protein FlgK [Bacteroidota bacterium]